MLFYTLFLTKCLEGGSQGKWKDKKAAQILTHSLTLGKELGHKPVGCRLQNLLEKDAAPAMIPTSETAAPKAQPICHLQLNKPLYNSTQRDFVLLKPSISIISLLRDCQHFHRLVSVSGNSYTSEKTCPVTTKHMSKLVLSQPWLPWAFCNLKHSKSKLPLPSADIILA